MSCADGIAKTLVTLFNIALGVRNFYSNLFSAIFGAYFSFLSLHLFLDKYANQLAQIFRAFGFFQSVSNFVSQLRADHSLAHCWREKCRDKSQRVMPGSLRCAVTRFRDTVRIQTPRQEPFSQCAGSFRGYL